jgi:hypothetical protein
MKQVLMISIFFASLIAWAGPAVLFEEVEVSPGSANRGSSQKTEITPLSQRSSLRKTHQSQVFRSAWDLRAKRRVAVGASTAGNTGMFGAFIELNLTPEHSAITAFGGGPGYNSFNFQWKRLLGSGEFSPYVGFGYSRWYSASGGGSVDRTVPTQLGARFLTKDEKESGKFAVDLVTPSLGLQYTQLEGESAGLGFFAEIDFLTPLRTLSPAPTGSLGALFYF